LLISDLRKKERTKARSDLKYRTVKIVKKNMKMINIKNNFLKKISRKTFRNGF